MLFFGWAKTFYCWKELLFYFDFQAEQEAETTKNNPYLNLGLKRRRQNKEATYITSIPTLVIPAQYVRLYYPHSTST